MQIIINKNTMQFKNQEHGHPKIKCAWYTGLKGNKKMLKTELYS